MNHYQLQSQLKGNGCLLQPSAEEHRVERKCIHSLIHSFILPTAVKIFYMGSYFCYHNCNSVCTIKVDDGGYMVGWGCK